MAPTGRLRYLEPANCRRQRAYYRSSRNSSKWVSSLQASQVSKATTILCTAADGLKVTEELRVHPSNVITKRKPAVFLLAHTFSTGA